ncbi:MAG: T9SS type A sorting domain-containing protein [Cytophagales bacterium]|nr:T9SS type A sorting domain-containing protein [Cytophagales bacterium]
MKKIFTILTITVAAMSAMAQMTPVNSNRPHPITKVVPTQRPIPTTIQEIQTVTAEALGNCVDTSRFGGSAININSSGVISANTSDGSGKWYDTVKVRGRLVVPPTIQLDAVTVSGVAYPLTTVGNSQHAGGRELYIQAGRGPFSGIKIRGHESIATTPDDLLTLAAGDSVEIEGIVNSFRGTTGIYPIHVTLIGQAPNLPAKINNFQVSGYEPVEVSIKDLNQGVNQNPLLRSGEKWEGMFVEIKNVTAVKIDPATANSNNTQRVRMWVEDDFGNQMQVYDDYRAGYTPARGGRYIIPKVGYKYASLKGVLEHQKVEDLTLNCTDIFTAFQDRGYQLHPFHGSHFGLGDTPPLVSNVSLSPLVPTASQSVTVSATIEPGNDGVTVTSANLFYGTDTLNYVSFTGIAMTKVGATWSATIPNTGFTDGQIVYFYFQSTDNRPLTGYHPRIKGRVITSSPQNPLFFVVRNLGLRLRDVQYTPFKDGRSGYEGRIVTVTGTVTSTKSDMGFVTLQDETDTEWCALICDISTVLDNLQLGEKVRIIGTVEERRANESYFTILTNIQEAPFYIDQNKTVTPLTLAPDYFSGVYDNAKHEKYESMLVKIANPTANALLYVVDTNADNTCRKYIDPAGTGTLCSPAALSGLNSCINFDSYAEYLIGTDTTKPLVGTRVLAGRTASFNNIINSFRFPLVARPYLYRDNTTGIITKNATKSPDSASIVTNIGKLFYVTVACKPRATSMRSMMGIAMESFGDMKILPRKESDVDGLNAVALPTTLPDYQKVNNALKLYPNPAENTLTVENEKLANYHVSISDLQGRVVVHEEVSGYKKEISTAGLQSGLYVVAVLSEGKYKMVRKLIIQK